MDSTVQQTEFGGFTSVWPGFKKPWPKLCRRCRRPKRNLWKSGAWWTTLHRGRCLCQAGLLARRVLPHRPRPQTHAACDRCLSRSQLRRRLTESCESGGSEQTLPSAGVQHTVAVMLLRDVFHPYPLYYVLGRSAAAQPTCKAGACLGHTWKDSFKCKQTNDVLAAGGVLRE